MDVLKISRLGVIAFVVFCSTGCQVKYLLKSGIEQTNILRKRVPLESMLEKADFDPKKKAKLVLIQEARKFAETRLSLKTTENYTTYVELGRPYVTWAVSAAPRWEMKHHLFWYPIVGSLPYKGFFSEEEAKEEAADLKKEDLDTFVRGVSAYSMLGWTSDPILSSMLNLQEYDLVDTIIHETVHTTLYISSAADFNERLASFIGELGAKMFYEAKGDHESVKKMEDSAQDSKLFSEFISAEVKTLEKNYADKIITTEEQRTTAFDAIKARFKSDVVPKLKSQQYKYFSERPLNNAVLLAFKTYWMDLHDFELAFQKSGNDFAKFLAYCKSLKNAKDPEKSLKDYVAGM